MIDHPYQSFFDGDGIIHRHNTSLEKLILQRTEIGDAGAAAFGEALRFVSPLPLCFLFFLKREGGGGGGGGGESVFSSIWL